MRRGRESRGADEALHEVGRGGRRRKALFSLGRRWRHFWWSRVASSRARDAEKKTSGVPPAPRGRAARVATSRARAPPPSPRSRPSGRPRHRDPRVRLVRHLRVGVGGARWARAGSSSRIRLDCRAGTLFFFFSHAERATTGRPDERERETGAGFPARAARDRRRAFGRASRAGPAARADPRGARGASSERLARDGRTFLAPPPPILRARASEEPFLPAGPRTRAPSAPSASPRARLLRVRPRALAFGGRFVALTPSCPRAPARDARAGGRVVRHRQTRPLSCPTRGSWPTVRSLRPVLSRRRAGAARGENPTVLSRTACRPRQRGSAFSHADSRRRFIGYTAHGERRPGGRRRTRVDRSFPPRVAL